MNNQANQWLALSEWFTKREQQLRRAGSMRANIAAPPRPAIQDQELVAFFEKHSASAQTPESCQELQVITTYQAVLIDPRSEQEILEAAGFLQNPKRLDALYAHAQHYTHTVEKEAKLELQARTSSKGGGRILQAFGLIVLLSMTGVGTWIYLAYSGMKSYLDQPAGATQGKVTLTIPKGSRSEKVAEVLHTHKVILDKERFYRLARYYHYWKRLFPQLPGNGQMRAGTYIFPTDLTPIQIFARLRKGPKRRSIRVTIPEGFNIFKIAARLEKKGICRASSFLYLARNPGYASRAVGWDTPSVEGYLYPDTYRFHKNASADKVIRRMIKRFKQLFSAQFKSRMATLNTSANHITWNIHKITTLASIIEKETGQKRERPMISSVFHNRIRKKWKLQTDPTVIYGLLPNFNGNITKKDLNNPHRYNTYQHKGLPPGPIASPGVAALRAALWPTKSRNMFFVSKNDGSHIFSRTLREHRKWVDTYQRKIRRRPKRKRRRKRRRRRRR